MHAIRLRTRIESAMLHLPELTPLIGKTVEIIVREEDGTRADTGTWQPLIDAAGQDLVDPDAYRQYREWDRDHLRAGER